VTAINAVLFGVNGMDVETGFALITTQLKEPFRIGLMIALVFMTVKNARATGWVLPLIFGVVFFAYMLAMTFPLENVTLLLRVLLGAISNGILVCVAMLGWFVISSVMKQKQPPT
jgi:hypothetical protein